MTSCAVICDCIDQPTIRREKRSSTTATYNHPSRPKIGEVGDPFLIGYRRFELPIEDVRGDRMLGPQAAIPRRAAAFGADPQVLCTHQALHPMQTTVMSPSSQIAVHSKLYLNL